MSSLAPHEIDPGTLVDIEQEDTELGCIGGLEVAAMVLKDTDAALESSLVSESSGTVSTAP